jgi:multiple sugar transport system ATP-binding protein
LVEALGNETLVTATFDQMALQIRVPPDQILRPGDDLWLAIVPDKLHLFDPDSGKNLQYR